MAIFGLPKQIFAVIFLEEMQLYGIFVPFEEIVASSTNVSLNIVNKEYASYTDFTGFKIMVSVEQIPSKCAIHILCKYGRIFPNNMSRSLNSNLSLLIDSV